MYELKDRTAIDYPSEAFDEFGCILTGELVAIIAESNSGKTTFALDMLERNSKKGIKGFYVNLEFPIETMWQSRRLWFHNKEKRDLSNEGGLTDFEKEDMKRYIETNLNKFKYYNSPNGIDLEKLEQIIEVATMDGYKLFVIDTFSRIHGNLERNARNNQNRCMEQLQELAQRLNIAIVMLHHTNRQGNWEGSQKIMDLSNVFIVISKMNDGVEEYRTYKLMKDKYVVNKELDIYYYGGKYVKDGGIGAKSGGDNEKPF